MKKYEIIKEIQETGLVAVIRAESAEQAAKSADAIVQGGIRILELTLTVPGAIDVISSLKQRYKGKNVTIGAGTVLDPETARLCILTGAEFIVAPSLNVDTIRLCNRYGVPIVPGGTTITEVVTALEYGADIVKLTPASAFEPSVIPAIRGPVPQVQFMVTGGISPENAGDWIRAGAVAVGAGGELTRGAKKGDYTLVTQTAEAYVREIQKARGK